MVENSGSSPPRPVADPAYRAFVSYSHAADGALAPALQRGLHRLAKPWYRPPAFRVFRDKTSLTATPSLWSSIEQALNESEFFILLASPAAAASTWVDREVLWWLDHKDRSRLFIVLTDGELVWDNERGDFDWTATTSLPPGLHGAFAAEPLWVDLRWADTPQDVSLRNPRFRDAVAAIAAPLHGVRKEQLVGEDLRQQRRMSRLRNAAIASLVVLALVATTSSVLFFVQRNVAREQRDLAVARQLAAQSSVEADRQPELSLLLAVASVKAAPESGRQAAVDHLQAILGRTYHISRTLHGPEAPVRDVSFTPGGAAVVSAAEDAVIRTWDSATGQPVGQPRRTNFDAAYSVAVSPDGRITATGSGEVQLWDSATGALLRTLSGHVGAVYALAFSPDGATIASGGADGTVRVWNTADGTARFEPLVHAGVVWDLAFSPDGATLASAGEEDHAIHLWNLSTGAPRGTPFTGHDNGLWDIEFSPNGATLLSASSDGTIRLWNVASHRQVRELRPADTRALAATFSPDGTTLASADSNGLIRLWDPETGEPRGEPLRGHLGAVWSLDFSPDGQRLVSGSSDETVRVWDVAEIHPLGQILAGHSLALSVAFTPDGAAMASGGADKGTDATVRLWDAAAGRERGPVLTSAQGQIWSVAFTPDGHQLAAGGRDGTIQLWDPASGTRGPSIAAHSEAVNGLAFSPDGRLLASTGDDGTARIWDAATGQALTEPLGVGEAGTGLAFSPDGTTLAVTSADTTITRWNTSNGQRVGNPLTGHAAGVYAVAFTPDGRSLVSGSADGSIRRWDAATGAPIGDPMLGHDGEVWTVAVSPDGRSVASGGADGTVRLWDMATGRAMGAPFGGFTFWVWDVAFRPDGKQLASASIDGKVRLWDLSPDTWLQKACTIAGRDLSSDEWHRFVGEEPPVAQTCP